MPPAQNVSQKSIPEVAFHERRQNPRRTVNLKAKAGLVSDAPTPCRIRNISALGALLEFDEPMFLPKHFRITIDEPHFSADCELRHRTELSAGVMFISNREEAKALFG